MSDYITRQDAIKFFTELWECIGTIGDKEEWEDVCKTTANEISSAQPERKKKKWVGADSQCGIGCPFCGMPVDDFCSSIDYIDLNYEPNFCPNCGEDMRGE